MSNKAKEIFLYDIEVAQGAVHTVVVWSTGRRRSVT
jgi:hypothetical protein